MRFPNPSSGSKLHNVPAPSLSQKCAAQSSPLASPYSLISVICLCANTLKFVACPCRHNGDEHGSMEVKLGIQDLEHIRQVASQPNRRACLPPALLLAASGQSLRPPVPVALRAPSGWSRRISPVAPRGGAHPMRRHGRGSREAAEMGFRSRRPGSRRVRNSRTAVWECLRPTPRVITAAGA